MINDDTQGFEDEPRVYEDCSPCLRSERSGLKTIVAMRGRNPENPSDRTAGSPTEQRLEANSQGICNTITSVQKDNLVLENVYDFYNDKMKDDGVCGTITGACSHNGSGTFGVIEKDVAALRMVRTEEGKALRKEYEAGKLHHGFNEHRTAEPRTDGVSNTLSTVQKDNMLLETVKVKQATKEGYIECKVGGVADLSFPDSATRRGRVQDMGDTCPTLMAGESDICRIESRYRIRKLTPLECWRLMDFTDEDFHKAEKVNSNTQLYKQAGNSIVKNVLVAIFGQILQGKENAYYED